MEQWNSGMVEWWNSGMVGLLNELVAKCVVLGLYLLISKPGCTTYSIWCMHVAVLVL